METITGRENSRLKFARRVRERREEDFVFVEGVRLCEEVLRTPLEILDAFFTSDFGAIKRETDLMKAISARAESSAIISAKLFASITDTKSPQGVAFICAEPKTGRAILETSLKQHAKSPKIILFLFEINNPANLGAILRSGEAAGVIGVITSKNCVDVFSSKAIRASMGAVFRTAIWKGEGFEETLGWCRQNGLTPVYADASGNKLYYEIDWKTPRLLIIGSEGHGLNESQGAQIAETIRIPMENEVESLNAGVACGIILFEAKRQSR
jgi:TrmH family RNA methyltransferase